MKPPLLLQKNLDANVGFSINRVKEFKGLWHYHPELELVYIAQGRGTLYAGDFIGTYEKDDIFLFGKNLPHMFQSKLPKDGSPYSVAYVFYINDSFLNENFLHLPEFNFLQDILTLSQQGVMYRQKENRDLLNIIKTVKSGSPAENTIKIFQLLYELYGYKEHQALGSLSWLDRFRLSDKRMEKVIEYIMLNFKSPISLDDIADYSAMNKTSFCRFFKENTGKSFVNFVNEVRIKYSCQLLIENGKKNTISEVCFQSGFNNVPYYSRQFKKIMGSSPSEYQKEKLYTIHEQ